VSFKVCELRNCFRIEQAIESEVPETYFNATSNDETVRRYPQVCNSSDLLLELSRCGFSINSDIGERSFAC